MMAGASLGHFPAEPLELLVDAWGAELLVDEAFARTRVTEDIPILVDEGVFYLGEHHDLALPAGVPHVREYRFIGWAGARFVVPIPLGHSGATLEVVEFNASGVRRSSSGAA